MSGRSSAGSRPRVVQHVAPFRAHGQGQGREGTWRRMGPCIAAGKLSCAHACRHASSWQRKCTKAATWQPAGLPAPCPRATRRLHGVLQAELRVAIQEAVGNLHQAVHIGQEAAVGEAHKALCRFPGCRQPSQHSTPVSCGNSQALKVGRLHVSSSRSGHQES